MNQIKSSQITPEHLYLSRRRFLIGAGALVAGTVLFGACGPGGPEPPDLQPPSPGTDELGDKITPYKDITNYNNFYEFSLQKEDVAQLAQNFQTSPWTVTVGGLVRQPQTFDIDDLRRRFPAEERIYRLRCVEGWSMVIPWDGFPLAKLLEVVEPTSEAKYVRFESLYDPKQMPMREIPFEWPYVEGLRLDEARDNLTLLATGIYGKPLLPQSGAPLRLVVPWKYGYKSIKSIVKIDLVAEMPLPFWVNQSSSEYGFYANVNPAVSHPRWSQASERRIGETKRRTTLLFNGYDKEVAPFYQGMDVEKLF
ncbi:MAG: protein-methionine-sulfoxide reductase catalytic subunit MsrP [Dehalococcoidales bacterium]|nr:protein-methionine-sulfoxide reductase catalytic subunit MsrP [Dehalococcoidales bacterium]